MFFHAFYYTTTKIDFQYVPLNLAFFNRKLKKCKFTLKKIKDTQPVSAFINKTLTIFLIMI